MFPRKAFPLRMVLPLLLLMAALPAALLVGGWGWKERQAALRSLADQGRLYADLIAGDLQTQVDEARGALQHLVVPGASEPVSAACDRLARTVQPPLWRSVGVLDERGRIVCSEPLPTGRRAAQFYAAEPWFDEVRGSSRTMVRGLAKGILFGLPTVAALVRLDGPSGFAGVAFATLSFERVEALLRGVEMPAGSSVTVLGPGWQVVARDPKLLGRYSGGRFLEGRDAQMARVLRERLERDPLAKHGSFEAADLDGEVRIFGFEVLNARAPASREGPPEFAGIVVVGLTRSAQLAEATRRIAVGLGAVVLAGLLGTVAIWLSVDGLVLRDVRATTATIARWKEGDHQARVGPTSGAREIQQLSHAFDDMADSLEQGLGHSSQALATLRDAQEALHGLARRLLLDQEAERRGLARELHDELGQNLTAVALALELVLRRPLPAADRERVESAREIVKTTLALVRRMSLDLHPQVLEDLGLTSALRAYVDRLAAAGTLRIDLVVDDDAPRPPAEIEAAAFRIVQEALTNVARHSGAGRAEVSVVHRPDSLLLEVRDDGHGFDAAAANSPEHPRNSLGLVGMQERAALVGGHLEVRSSPTGTRVRAELPLGDDQARSAVA